MRGLSPARWAIVAGAAIVVLYLATRLVLLWRFPPFWDEGQYAGWAQAGFDDPDQRFLALANGKQPMLAWLGTSAIALGAEAFTAVRVVSAISGLVTLTMMGLIGRRLGGPRVGLAAAAVGAFVPYLFVHNAIGIMEPLVVAATTTALYLQLRLAAEPRVDLALLLGGALPVGVLTKDTARVAVVLLPVSLLCFDWRGSDVKRRLGAWVGCSAIALAVAWVGYSALRLSDLYDDFGTAREQIAMFHGFADALAHPWRYAEENWPLFRSALGGYVTLPLVLAAVVGAGLARGRSRASPAFSPPGWSYRSQPSRCSRSHPGHAMRWSPFRRSASSRRTGSSVRSRPSPGGTGWPPSPSASRQSCPRSCWTPACSPIRPARATPRSTTRSSRPAGPRVRRSSSSRTSWSAAQADRRRSSSSTSARRRCRSSCRPAGDRPLRARGDPGRPVLGRERVAAPRAERARRAAPRMGGTASARRNTGHTARARRRVEGRVLSDTRRAPRGDRDRRAVRRVRRVTSGSGGLVSLGYAATPTRGARLSTLKQRSSAATSPCSTRARPDLTASAGSSFPIATS